MLTQSDVVSFNLAEVIKPDFTQEFVNMKVFQNVVFSHRDCGQHIVVKTWQCLKVAEQLVFLKTIIFFDTMFEIKSNILVDAFLEPFADIRLYDTSFCQSDENVYYFKRTH